MEKNVQKDVQELAIEYRLLEQELMNHIVDSNRVMKSIHNDIEEAKTDPNSGLVAIQEEFTGSFLGTLSQIAESLKAKQEEVVEAVSSMEDVAKIGDIVEYEILSGEEIRVESGKLIPTFSSRKIDINEKLISIISPIGSAIYGKPIGTKCNLGSNTILLLSGIIKEDTLTNEPKIIRIKEHK